MYTYQKVKCEKCGVEQEVNSKEYTECPNGCYRVKLSHSGWSYSYSVQNGMSNCLDRKTYKERNYIEDKDYIEPDNETLELINKIESYEDKFGFKCFLYKTYDKFENNPKVLNRFKFIVYDTNYYHEKTEFSLNISFIDENYNFYNDKEKKIKEIKQRMKYFIEVLDKLVNKELDIKDREYIDKNIDYRDASSERKDLRDDTYYF